MYEAYLWYLFLVFISALSVASVVWFFKKRRELIVFLRDVTRVLEDYYKPSSKEYVWLGYLVGYRARYVLPGKHRVYILLTTVPKHVFFYLPVIALFKKRDRIEVAMKPHDRYVIGEVHIYRAGSWIAEVIVKKNIAQKLSEYAVKEFEVSSGKYIAYYKDERVLDAIYKIISSTNLPVLYAYTHTGENIVSMCCELSLENLKQILSTHRQLVELTTKPKVTK